MVFRIVTKLPGLSARKTWLCIIPFLTNKPHASDLSDWCLHVKMCKILPFSPRALRTKRMVKVRQGLQVDDTTKGIVWGPKLK